MRKERASPFRDLSSLTYCVSYSDDYDDRRPIETPDDKLKAAIISYGEVVRHFVAYFSSYNN